jgi:enoyl-CoA hydratase/carnithine racemase
MSEYVTSELSGGILQLTINRPDKKNALTQDMYTALVEALEQVANDRAIKAVHLTGAGDAFTAGNDLADFVNQAAMAGDPPVYRFLRALPRVEVPLVAAVNGLAVGVGVTLLLHCDFVFASEDAVFSTPFVDLGVVPEAGSSLLMPRQMGYLNAARMLLLGDKLNAEDAMACGLVGEVVDKNQLLQKSLATAAALAAKPPAAMRTAKRLLRRNDESLAERMQLEFELFGAALQSPEAAEAMAAFFEKRAPDFSRFE